MEPESLSSHILSTSAQDDDGEWEAGGEKGANIESREGTGRTIEASSAEENSEQADYIPDVSQNIGGKASLELYDREICAENPGNFPDARGAPSAAQSVIEPLAHEEGGSEGYDHIEYLAGDSDTYNTSNSDRTSDASGDVQSLDGEMFPTHQDDESDVDLYEGGSMDDGDDGEGEEDDNIENREGTGETRGASSAEENSEQVAETDNSGSVARTAAQLVIEKLDSIVMEDGSWECAICRYSAVPGDQATPLPCMHLFYRNCIVEWLRYENLCPLCRGKLPTDGLVYEEANAGRRTSHNYHGQNFNHESSSESSDTQELESAGLEQQPDAESLPRASRTLGNPSVVNLDEEIVTEDSDRNLGASENVQSVDGHMSPTHQYDASHVYGYSYGYSDTNSTHSSDRYAIIVGGTDSDSDTSSEVQSSFNGDMFLTHQDDENDVDGDGESGLNGDINSTHSSDWFAIIAGGTYSDSDTSSEVQSSFNGDMFLTHQDDANDVDGDSESGLNGDTKF